MNRKSLARVIAFILIALCVGACARTVVRPESEMKSFGMPRPREVIVCDFAVNEAEAAENQEPIKKMPAETRAPSERERGSEIERHVAKALAAELVRNLRDLGFTVEQRPRGTPVGRHQLLIDGEFLDVDEGSRLKRLVIGFGVGASKVDTEVQVYYGMGRRKLLDFRTHADSGKMPGAAATVGAGAAIGVGIRAGTIAASAAEGALKEYYSEVERMAAHSADQAVAYLSEFFAKQDWIRPDQVKRPKLER